MFVKKPRSSNAYEGDTVIIYCEVVGDPQPQVAWLRDFLKVGGGFGLLLQSIIKVSYVCLFLMQIELRFGPNFGGDFS